MIKKMTVILLMTLFATLLGAETKIIPTPDLMKPEALFFDKTQMYVTEGTSIFIYSLKDLKLIKKFGKKGEGPQEFMVNPQFGPLFIDVNTEDIIVNSFGKLSWFTKEGKFKRELKLSNPFILFIQPFGKNFVGIRFSIGEKRMQILNLYDDKINELKEITKQEHFFQPGKGLRVLEPLPYTIVKDNKLFLAWEKDLVIKVLDTELKELYAIKYDVEKRKVTEEDKKEVINFLKTTPPTKDFFELLKPIHFPEYYPAMQIPCITGNKIYVVTFKKEDDGEKTEILLFNMKGKFLKQVFIPIKMDTPIQPYPFNIHEGFLYQVVEDEEEEEWALHVSEIN
jgi:hypothetical protein